MHRNLSLGALAALVALAAPPLDAQERDRGERVASRIDTTLAFSPNGAVDLSLVSGQIVVTTWPRSEVRVQATSERGQVRLRASSSRLSLGVESERGRTGDTRYEVTVPVGTRVAAQTTSGDIAVRGTRAEVELRSVSGGIELEDAAERITMHSVSGDVRGRRLAGSTRAESVSGDVELAEVRGDTEAESVSGDIVLEGITSRFVDVETVSGEVRFRGGVDPTGRYDFKSHSGDVRLMLPAELGAVVDVETFSGEIESDFPITLPAGTSIEGRPRRVEFVVGRGGARISAETFSGDIALERGTGRAAQ